MRLRNYKKPELPERCMLLHEDSGLDDGPFHIQDLTQSTLPGNPWGFAANGSTPTVLRVIKQEGDRIFTEDSGVIVVIPAPLEVSDL